MKDASFGNLATVSGNLVVMKDASFGGNVYLTKLPVYTLSGSSTTFNNNNFITKSYADTKYIMSPITTINNNLTVSGTVTANAFYATSDKRLKTDIQLMPSQWNNIKLLQPSEYKWLDTNKEDYGFIAQEVFDVYPNMKPPFYYPKSTTSTMEEPVDIFGDPLYYSIDYGKMTAFLCKGLQEAMEMIETQQEEIQILKQKIDTIQKTMNN